LAPRIRLYDAAVAMVAPTNPRRPKELVEGILFAVYDEPALPIGAPGLLLSIGERPGAGNPPGIILSLTRAKRGGCYS
jgi:hypothetical protein